MVQWLRLFSSNVGGRGLIPGQGTMIPHAVQCSQKRKKEKGSYILTSFPGKKKKKPPTLSSFSHGEGRGLILSMKSRSLGVLCCSEEQRPNPSIGSLPCSWTPQMGKPKKMMLKKEKGEKKHHKILGKTQA